jgi:hypothetical protein
MARERLKSAAEIEIRDASSAGGGKLTFRVAVKNVGAGHNLPTSLTEVREMWVELTVTGPDGSVLHRGGALDERGEIPEGSIRFGALMEDAGGRITVKPWEGVRFRSKRLVPPRGEDVSSMEVALPSGTTGKVVIAARLLYRSASPAVIRLAMGDEAFEAEVVEMCSARCEVEVR